MSTRNDARAWGVLLVSAVLEAVWATALDASHGLSRPGATALFVVALTASMLGLGYAARHIPIGTAYAIWTGVGAALTVTWAMVTGTETASALKVLFLAGIVGCAVGLKLVGHDDAAKDAEDDVSAGARPAPRPGRGA